MLFNSYPFLLLFLPITLAGFFALGSWRFRAAAVWLVAASLVFYGWWDVRFLSLLVPSVLLNFAAGWGLSELAAGGRHYRKQWLLGIVIAVNLVILGYFKYMNFFILSVNVALGSQLDLPSVILPLGISFFTFTQIAFLIDAARGEVRHFDFVHYCLFVTYFPHLIAGPILHHHEMMPQFRSRMTYVALTENFAVGLTYLAIGLAKKCLIADRLSPDVGMVFRAAQQGDPIGAVVAWRGALAYTLQLYFDFSGYCDMAVGLSRMFGIRLPFNFNSPYQALGIIEFWRRWHMTLSRFLRDYLYIPMGGNRRGPLRRYGNLMATMVLGGLWHGANWTFVAWGCLHGAYLLVNHAWRATRPTALDRWPAGLRNATSVAVTFTAVVVAWVVFRAPDLSTAGHLLAAMAGANGLYALVAGNTSETSAVLLDLIRHVRANPVELVGCGLVFLIVFAVPNTQHIVEGHRVGGSNAGARARPCIVWRSNLVWGAVLGVVAAAALMTFTRVSEFLYFQF